jgi:Rho-binding antiterminator
MKQYPIKLTLKDGIELAGQALDTGLNAERQECIKVNVQSQEKMVTLQSISSLEVMIKNPHFQLIKFS